MGELPIFPVAASAEASQADLYFFVLLAFSGAITVLVAGLILIFGIRYRRGSSRYRGPLPGLFQRELEVGWTLATAGCFIIFFIWAVVQDLSYLTPPRESLQIHVLGKQWMWKVRHPQGAVEINAVHVPKGRDVTLLLNSRDVIHSFYVPAFRLKRDVVPGRTEKLWFNADRAGTFHLFCAEFCGTEHSKMTGKVVVMEPEDYAEWLTARAPPTDLAGKGEALFTSLGCAGCHASRDGVRAPRLNGVFGRPVLLSGERHITADDRYIRDSILRPRAEVVAGYDPIMPSYEGIVDDAELAALLAYIKSLDEESQP